MKIELSRKKLLNFGIPVLILCLVPVFLGGSPHLMHILIMCLIWAIVATAWDLVIGYGGIFSVGSDCFFRYRRLYISTDDKSWSKHSGSRNITLARDSNGRYCGWSGWLPD